MGPSSPRRPTNGVWFGDKRGVKDFFLKAGFFACVCLSIETLALLDLQMPFTTHSSLEAGVGP